MELIRKFVSLVVPDGRQPQYDPVLEAERQARMDAAAAAVSASPLRRYVNSSSDEEEEEEEEEVEWPPAEEDELRYNTDEEANAALVKAYWLYMQNHYGRPPKYRTDLYCAMLFVDVRTRMDLDDTERYWWVAVNHPLAIVLDNYYKAHRRHAPVRTHDSDGFGMYNVYSDDTMEFCIDQLVELYMDHGYTLEQTRSRYAHQKLVQEGDEEEESVRREDVAITVESPNSVWPQITREEGSKKEN